MTLSRAALELLIRAATSTPVLVVVVDMPWLDQEALPDGTIAPTGKAFAATPMPQVGAARCCTCTDFPYETGDIFVRAIDDISASGIPDDQSEAILERNAMTLLGIGSVGSR